MCQEENSILTSRQQSVMQLFCNPSISNNAEIAERLNLSLRYVQELVQQIYDRLGLYDNQRNRLCAVLTFSDNYPEEYQRLKQRQVVLPEALPTKEQRRAALRPGR